VAALLSARARAVLTGGVGAIEATGGGAVFDARRLAALPFEGWTYDVAQVTTTADPRRFDVAARLDYRLAGEPAPTGAALQLVVADTARGWRVQEERSTTGSLLWEVGPLTVVTGARTLVIGVGNPAGGAAALRGWAADGAIAVRQIRAAVPDGWPGRLTLVVPGSSADTARLTGRSTESLEGLAAVTLAEAQPTAGSGQRVFRVYLDLPVVAGISGVARQIVLRHEVTHVATGAPATNATPLWLEEGYAQYLGYRGSAVPLRVAVRDLRADRLPSRPPSDDEFTGQRAAAAYEAAHVLCVVMAEQVGEDGLLRVYRRTASGLGFVAAWRSVAHEGQGALFAAWRDRMRAETS
jgi:hypothetical protein